MENREQIENQSSICLKPGNSTPTIPLKPRKRAFSETELGYIVDILKDYQDFTPLVQKNDIISKRLKRTKLMQKELSKLTHDISSVQLEKNDPMIPEE